MRYFLAIFVLSIAAVIGVLGFRGTHFRKPPLYIFPDMEWQPKLRPQKPNAFFANGLSSQLPVAGTVARSTPIQTADGPAARYQDLPVNTGLVPGTTNYVDNNPLQINAALMQRGQQRFTIYCSPCHGQLGDGNGITKKIGAMPVVGNLHDKRMVEMGDGELFYVISNGRNQMGSYAGQISVEDRWAIVAYVRALQLSQLGTIEDVPQELRSTLKK